jgi:hypothetical protein
MGTVLASLLTALMIAACAAGTPERVLVIMRDSRQVVDGVDSARGAPEDLKTLNRAADSLATIDRSAVAQRDLRDLKSLETALDTRLATLAASVSYNQALQAQKMANSSGRAVAEAVVDQNTTKAKFIDDLADVTAEAVKGQACDALRKEALSDTADSSEPAGDEAGWKGDIAHAAQVLLAKTWNATKVEVILNWEDWAARVAKSADDVSRAAANNPDLVLRYVTQPSARMGAVEYAKFCHGFPTP